MIDSTELVLGPHTHSARAAGPADGELVLLLHGFPETSYEWRAQLEALGAAGYRAVAPDQRGYAAGARPRALDDYSVERLVDDVFGFADALGVDRFHLVGHDWGGFVAWYAAARDSRRDAPRLGSLAVVSTPHPVPFRAAMHSGGDQRERSSYMEWFRSPDAEAMWLADDAALLAAAYGEHPADAREEYLRVFTADGGAALTGGLNWYRANTFHDPGGPVTAPTLYVWSTDDVALGREAAEATGAQVAGPYRFVVLDGVSHWIPEVAAARFDPLLLEHLAGARASS